MAEEFKFNAGELSLHVIGGLIWCAAFTVIHLKKSLVLTYYYKILYLYVWWSRKSFNHCQYSSSQKYDLQEYNYCNYYKIFLYQIV